MVDEDKDLIDDEDDIDIDLDDESDFDDFNGQGNTLGDLWRNNPLVKVGIITVAVVAVFFAIITLGGQDDVVERSIVSGGSEISAPPATSEAPPAYVEAIEETNEENVFEAYQTGGSAIPVPISTPRGVVEIEQDDLSVNDEEDPLERWKRLQEERLQRELEQQPVIGADIANQPVGPDPALEALADVMSQQMQSILENQSSVNVSFLGITPADFLEQKAAQEAAAQQALLEQQNIAGTNVTNGQNTPAVKPIIPAADIAYAQLITEANSDTPGPVLAQLAGGPLSGSRLLGDFKVEGKLLILSFNTIVIDGIAQRTSAVAIDPGTTIPGLATEVDNRYFTRVVLPAAAAFVEGAAEAISDSGRTTITVDGGAAVSSTADANNDQEIASGIEELGEEIGDLLDEIANETKPLIRIASGTPMGILFLEGVFPPGTNVNSNVNAGSPAVATTTNNTNLVDDTENPLNTLNLFQN